MRDKFCIFVQPIPQATTAIWDQMMSSLATAIVDAYTLGYHEDAHFLEKRFDHLKNRVCKRGGE